MKPSIPQSWRNICIKSHRSNRKSKHYYQYSCFSIYSRETQMWSGFILRGHLLQEKNKLSMGRRIFLSNSFIQSYWFTPYTLRVLYYLKRNMKFIFIIQQRTLLHSATTERSYRLWTFIYITMFLLMNTFFIFLHLVGSTYHLHIRTLFLIFIVYEVICNLWFGLYS